MSTHQITTYTYTRHEAAKNTLRFAIVADLHNGPWEDVRDTLKSVDAILVVGDLVNRHRRGTAYAKTFVREAPALAPTFFSIGNHERKSKDMGDMWPVIQNSRMTILDNTYVHFQGIVLGGLSSHEVHAEVQDAFLHDMAQEDGLKLLMCHHPEYYPLYVKGKGIDLTVSGHAHGGQIQIAGHGLYAPGQGIFPHYTHGFYDHQHLLVSRGMTNSAKAPRLWNPLELLVLTIVY